MTTKFTLVAGAMASFLWLSIHVRIAAAADLHCRGLPRFTLQSGFQGGRPACSGTPREMDIQPAFLLPADLLTLQGQWHGAFQAYGLSNCRTKLGMSTERESSMAFSMLSFSLGN